MKSLSAAHSLQHGFPLQPTIKPAQLLYDAANSRLLAKGF
jgi:hypothetical protein